VHGWQVYDNFDLAGPRLIASGAAGGIPVVADATFWMRLGLASEAEGGVGVLDLERRGISGSARAQLRCWLW
jgi:hypothetical protein